MRHAQRGMTLVEVIIASAILVGLVAMTFLIMNRSTEDHEQNAKKLDLDHRTREVLNEITREGRMANTAMITAWDAQQSLWVPVTMETASASQTEYTSIRFQMLKPGDFDLEGYFEATKGNGQDVNRRWGRRVTYRWVVDTGEIEADGLDNDNDGIADEGRIERVEEEYVDGGAGAWSWQTTSTSIICDDVPWDPNAQDTSGNSEPKGWLKFSFVQPDYILMTLRLEVVDPKTPNKDVALGAVDTFRRTVSTRIETRNN